MDLERVSMSVRDESRHQSASVLRALHLTSAIVLSSKIHLVENNDFIILISYMGLNDLIESNPTLFRIIAVIGGLLVGYIIYIIQF